MKKVIVDAGYLGPLVFILFQMLQVIVAPIPGQVTGIVGGYLFGTFLGATYALLGATIASICIFFIVRKLGEPIVRRFVPAKVMNRFDYLAKTKGPLAFFLVFLFPVFPDDLICFIAGLTKIPIKTLIVISVVGRLPGYVMLSYVGSSAAGGYFEYAIGMTVVLLVLCLIAYKLKRLLFSFVRGIAKK